MLTRQEETEILNWIKNKFPDFKVLPMQVFELVKMIREYHESELKKLRETQVMQRSEQVAVDCNYCGRLYGDTMCKLHPAPCKKH